MEVSLIEVLAQHGITGILLCLMLYWLVKFHLPEHQRAHQAELNRILESHSRHITRLVEAMERNTRILYYNSQALLVLSFIQNGMQREEAEKIVERIRLEVEGEAPRQGNGVGA